LTALSQPEQREAATIAGADDFMTKPVTRDALNEHVTKLLQSGPTSKVAPPTPVKEPSPPPANQSSARAQAPTGSSVIVIMGLQVGVGSTTLAVNMALSLMQHGRTCVIDLNQQGGQVAVHFGMTPPHSTWQHLVGAQPGTDKRMIGSALMMDPHSHLAIMAAPMTPATQRFAVDSFGYVVTVIMEGFHHVVIDLPPSLDEMAQAVLKNAHHVVLVADNDPAKIPLCAEMIRQVQRMDLRGQTHVVLNNSRLQGIPSDEVARKLNYPLAATIPFEDAQIQAVSNGVPIYLSNPESLHTRTILQLIRQFRLPTI